MIAVFFNVLWRYVVRAGLLGHDADKAAAERISRQYSFGPLLYLVCLALVWVNIPVSLLVNLGLAIFFALPPEYVVKKES